MKKQFGRRGGFWNVSAAYRTTEAHAAFGSLDAAAAARGETVTSSPISCVRRISLVDGAYYVKIYNRSGKGLRRYLGRSRARAEWENLMLFRKLGIPTADLVAYGQKRRFGFFRKGGIVTREIENCRNLARMANREAPELRDSDWVGCISEQVAEITKKMHETGFVHNDLKWRNILVTQFGRPRVYLIDCPAGRIPFRFWRRRWVIKDLACLDKVARQRLRRSQRLRFFMHYAGCRRLSPEHKRTIREVLLFFQGRE